MVESDAHPSAFLELDDDGRYLDASDDVLAAFGMPIEELRQHRVGDFAPPGLGPIHRALFLWVARQGRDFGGGSSAIVGRDGRSTPVRVTRIARQGDRHRVEVELGAAEAPGVHSDAIPAVLEAWRRAERQVEHAETTPDWELARQAADAIREVYHTVASEKAASD